MGTIIWIFNNAMSYVGIWFTVMTTIFFLSLIYCTFRIKFWIKPATYRVDKTFELSTIISLVPLFLSWCLLGFMDLLTLGRENK